MDLVLRPLIRRAAPNPVMSDESFRVMNGGFVRSNTRS